MSNLLIIDDDASQSAALAALLRREGHQVTQAASAGEALRHLRQDVCAPDLVLLDLGLPRVDGLDLLDALTDEPQFAGLRVAVYSGRDEPESRERSRRLGACDYIVKGTDWEQTYARIRSCLPYPVAPAAANDLPSQGGSL
jgi:DNA-binding response OmpR family regulator